uniref:LisH domain-containing protein n=1 Tax=Anabas testudineus TaxID=64144 RepID=A0A7N6FDL4_ANATE
MSSSKEAEISPDELRKRLYQTFKNKGVLDTLKTQLRNQLIQELKHPPLTGGEPVPRPVPVKSETLLVSACNSIVADHLRASGYEYTLSVFHPESGLHKDKVFTKEDLLHLLKLSPESALYRSLVNNCISYAQLLILSFCLPCTVDKMKMIDKEYENFSYSEDKWFSLQSKLAAYRKDVETQMEAEMKTKMQHFRDFEMAKVRMEEKEKFHKEFDKLKKELERTYEMKSKALMEREKNAIDRLQKQQEIEEKNVYMQRQSVLKEIETLRSRENEQRMRVEAFEKTCQIHEEKVKTTEELLRRRELAIKTMEDTYDQRLRNELSRFQLELKDDFMRRTEKLVENENKNKGQYLNYCIIKDKLVDVLHHVQQTTQPQSCTRLLRERLDNMSDYAGLKREKTELQGQLRLLRKQLEEAQEENRFLHADLGKPSKEQLALQMELRRLQSARQLDEEEFENQKQMLQAQLQSEVERCTQLKAQLKESEEKSQWMTNHVEDIKMQLRQTHQALENEVLRNPKPSLVDRSVLEFSADKLVPPDIYVDRALMMARVGYDDVCEAGPYRRHTSAWTDTPDSDMELVAEAKARILELQKEAETLEEAYRNYQQRAVRSTMSHLLTRRPLSPQHGQTSHHPESTLTKQVYHHSHILSLQESHKPLCPQTPLSESCDTKNSTTPAQPRVTFSEDYNQPMSTVHTDHSLRSMAEPLFLKDETPRDGGFSPSRRLSSTPHSSPGKKLQKEIPEGTYKMFYPENTFQRD